MSKRGALFSFSAEQDRSYALGWPHLRTLVDKHKLDKKADDAARAILNDPDPPALFSVEWPRETAHRFVRALGESSKSEIDAALAKPGPVSADEARALIAKLLTPVASRPQMQVADFLFLLEAMVGTEVVADAILTRFEKFSPKDWLGDALRSAFFTAIVAPVALPMAYHLGFFLLRLPESQKKKLRARIEALHKKAGDGRPLQTAFDLVLHGSEAVRRHRVRALCVCHFVLDDPALVRSLSQTDEHVFSLSPRFVYLGGEATLDHYAERAKALPRWSVLRFTEEFGHIKHPKIVPIMLTMWGKKTAKDAPLRWFEAHAEFARPLLEEIAIRKSPQGEAARAVIEALDAPKPATPSKKGGKPAPPPPPSKSPSKSPSNGNAVSKRSPSAAAKSKSTTAKLSKTKPAPKNEPSKRKR